MSANLTYQLTKQDSSIPLHLINSSDYETWLGSQPTKVQQWLTNSQYSKSGVALIPGNDGNLEAALAVVPSTLDYFACGQLAKSLPEGTYTLEQTFSDEELLAIAFGWGVGSYCFDRYAEKPTAKAQLEILNETIFEKARKLIEATFKTRDLVNTPAADMMPEHLSDAVQTLAKEFSADFSEIVGDDLIEQNYPMIHAVGRASQHAPRLLELTWGNPDHPKITLVGKGICFDSGGLNLKPGDSMRNMKKDMGGAAHVVGLAYLIMANALPVRLRLLIPAAENSVAGNAFRPGDVIPTRKGLTIEIDNTDAEGRLVLCDALFEAASESPDLIIDFATLTGASRVALGTDLPGFFTNQKELAADIMQAGEPLSDPVWNMPLFRMYKESLKSEVADMVNCASGFGGAITAALYLEAFVEEVPWVHFDIMAWNRRAMSGKPVGGEAMGLRAMFGYLESKYA